MTDETIDNYRKQFPQQPQTNASDLAAAIIEFETMLPGWWWSVCVCSRTRDASCGPDMAGPDHALLQQRKFDQGFDVAIDGTLAEALRTVMMEALEAKRAALTGDRR